LGLSSFRGIPIHPAHIQKCVKADKPRRKKPMPFPSKNSLLKALTEARDITIKTREGKKWEILYHALCICIDVELDSPNSLKHDVNKLANAATIYIADMEETK
jgi:hypothetical protein